MIDYSAEEAMIREYLPVASVAVQGDDVVFTLDRPDNVRMAIVLRLCRGAFDFYTKSAHHESRFSELLTAIARASMLSNTVRAMNGQLELELMTAWVIGLNMTPTSWVEIKVHPGLARPVKIKFETEEAFGLVNAVMAGDTPPEILLDYCLDHGDNATVRRLENLLASVARDTHLQESVK